MIKAPDLTIVMPCLNEAETLAACIHKAKAGCERAGIAGEIVVADNGSTDGSIEIAEKLGAHVVRVAAKGYGSALGGGIAAASGKWILIGDADDSYDFSDIGGFIDKLREGCDLVMGCRLPGGGGTIAPGAMPWKNRRIGNPALSFLGRIFFKTPVHDFHCGLRAFTKAACDRMDLKTTGMEFASEMVIKAALKSMRVAEVPVTLHPDGRSRAPHLRSWRDGWRHLRFMLIYAPTWLFLVPGLILFASGFAAAALLYFLPLRVDGVVFDAGSLVIACACVTIGIQMVAFAFFTKTFAVGEGLMPETPAFTRVFRIFTLEKGVVAGAVCFLTGAALLVHAIHVWKRATFGLISYPENLRRVVSSATLIVVGIQIVSSSFFMSVLGLKTANRKPPATSDT